MKEYRVVDGKKYRYGFTTGTTATAAATAAAYMVLNNEVTEEVEVILPAGDIIALEVVDIEKGADFVSCAVVKDGGDDPDVTHGIKIFCRASKSEQAGITIKTGKGIGIATLPGLKIEVGEPAINPVPRQMIMENVGELLDEGQGVELFFTIPQGEEIAKETYNPRLGIIGGISIVGTTGIVKPMSEEAWRDAIEQEIAVVTAAGHKTACLVFGNYGEDFALNKLGIAQERIVKISNFVGYFLRKCTEYNLERILFIGHIGKLIKVSGGIFQTHSSTADARMEMLVFHLAMIGADQELLEQVFQCRTSDAAREVIAAAGYDRVYQRIADACSYRCEQYSFNKLEVASIVFGGKDIELARCGKTAEMIERLKSGE